MKIQITNMDKLERDRFNAWVGHSNSNGIIWGQYERLFEFIFVEFSKTNRRFDEISIPMLSILSHAIELGLKENIKLFSQYHKSKHLTEFENLTSLIKSHDLKSLSKEFKTGYFKLHKKVDALSEDKLMFNNYFKELQKLIKILERNTETYRYAFKIDNQGNFVKDSIKYSKIIDFLTLKELFTAVQILLIGAPNSLGRYIDYIDFKEENPEYDKGKGYLYCQKLAHSEHFLLDVKNNLNDLFTKIEDNRWLDSNSGENYELQVWKNNIYIISI